MSPLIHCVGKLMFKYVWTWRNVKSPVDPSYCRDWKLSISLRTRTSSQSRHLLGSVRLRSDNKRQCDGVTITGSDDSSFLFSCISKHDLRATPQGHKCPPHDWVGVWKTEGSIHLNGVTAPHPVPPSVDPVSQLLASRTLLGPKLLKHDAPVIICSLPAHPGGHLFL